MRIPISTVSRVLAGETSCLFRPWWELRHPNLNKDNPGIVQWRVAHSRAVRDVANRVTGSLEAEVPVALESMVFGRADLVEHLDGQLVVREVKTGRSSPADVVQTMLYMKLLAAKRRLPVIGVVHRPDSTTEIPFSEVPMNLVSEALDVARILESDSPPPRVEERACAWCAAACPFARGGTPTAPSSEGVA